MKIAPTQSNPVHTSRIRFEVDVQPLPNVETVELKGSFDPQTGAYRADWNEGRTIPMRDDGKGGDRKAGDGIYTAELDLAQSTRFQWGAVDQDGKWLVTQESNLELDTGNTNTASYAPVSFHRMGLQRDQQDLTFKTWAPQSNSVQIEFYNDAGETVETHALAKEGDYWSTRLKDGLTRLEGLNYRLVSDKATYIDPHARYLKGQQRGLERIFVDPVLGFETGWYDDSGKGGPNYADNPQWGRFVVDDHPDAEEVRLVFRDADGHRLNKAQLLERLGQPGFTSYEQASPEDRRDVDVLHAWQLNQSPSVEPYVWTRDVGDDGAISMQKWESETTGGGWTSVVNNFPQLVGLSYEFEVVKGGAVVGDRDGNGELSSTERLKTPFNESANTITAQPSSARGGKVKFSSFEPKYFDTPRMEDDPEKFVIYELHVGSFLSPGDNAVPPTFEDLVQNLDYLADLGVNTLELMPTQEFGGKRDWGYTPDHYFAGSDAYGFEMDRSEALEAGLIESDEHPDQSSVWVNGTDALKFFVDQAHKRGFQVLGDVVYNHTSGKPDGDNPLYAIDGQDNSFFRWPDGQVHSTPWGAKPNFAAEGVKRFFADHATSQLVEYGFDGLRFDFTQVLHNTGDAFQQTEGMNTLRQINRAIDLVRPEALNVAEDFSGNWLVAADYDQAQTMWGVEKKGMGFDRIWNDRFRDDVFHSAEGGSMDRLMDSLLNHHGVSGWDRAVLYAHSHDEVGNSGEWIGRAAAGSKQDSEVLKEFPRGISRTAAALTILGPGMPMLWQGEEFLANNDFKHGLTSTWGQPTEWLHNEDTQEPRDQHHRAFKDLVALRGSSNAFKANSEISRVMTHNDHQLMAFSRKRDGEEYVVIANLSNTDRPHYHLNLPPGNWEEVFNSDAERYGGGGMTNDRTVGSQANLNLPGASAIVLKKV